jgi:GTPase SAR1 family protein
MLSSHSSVRVKHETLITRRLRVLLTGDACSGKTALLKLANSISTSSHYEFPRSYVPTTFPEWVSVMVRVPASDLPEGTPPTQVELLVLDTPGSSVLNLRGDVAGGQKMWATCSASIFVFDVTARESFASIDKWASKVQSLCGAPLVNGAKNSSSGGATLGTQGDMGIAKKSSPPFAVLVGTKADLRENDRTERAEVSLDDARQLAARLGPRLGVSTQGKSAPYFEVSAEHNIARSNNKGDDAKNVLVDVERPFVAIATQWAKHCLEEELEE